MSHHSHAHNHAHKHSHDEHDQHGHHDHHGHGHGHGHGHDHHKHEHEHHKHEHDHHKHEHDHHEHEHHDDTVNEYKALQLASNYAARRKLWIAAGLCSVFMVGEVVGGWYAGSLAIMTDAAHLLSDLGGFFISLFALYLSTRAATHRHSFGFHRAEILGALLSVFVIWLLTGILLYEAIQRVLNPTQVDGKIMFIVAAGGVFINILMATQLHSHSHGLGGGHGHSHGGGADEEHDHAKHKLLQPASVSVAISASSSSVSVNQHDHEHEDDHAHNQKQPFLDADHGHGHSKHADSPLRSYRGRSHSKSHHDHDDHGHEEHGNHEEHENINLRAAYIHVLGDLIQSVGVMIAGGLIWYNPDWKIVDPIATFVFSVIVLYTTFQLIRESFHVLMEGTPEGIDPHDVVSSLRKLDGVAQAHDLHIWSLSVGKSALSVHIRSVLTKPDVLVDTQLLQRARDLCRTKFGITHTTIQIEHGELDFNCDDHFH